jgi:predicted RNA polymerase sigma factor
MTAPDLRTLTPQVIGILIRRGADFATAEDAVQEALMEALRVWPDDPPRLADRRGLAQIPRHRPLRGRPSAS